MILFRPCRCEMLVSVYPESTTLRPSNRRASDATIGVFVGFVSWKNMKNKLQVISKSNATKFHFLPQSWQGKTTPNERKLLLEGTISHFHDYERKGKANFVFLHTSLSFISGFRCALFFFSLAQRFPKRFPKRCRKTLRHGKLCGWMRSATGCLLVIGCVEERYLSTGWLSWLDTYKCIDVCIYIDVFIYRCV